MFSQRLLQIAAVLGVVIAPLRSEVKLPKILSSHVVLQRDRPIHLWGWSDVGERISAQLNGATQTAVGDALGHWSLSLAPQSAGGPFQVTIQGTNRVVLDDVLIGDVWFASGQSNMEMPLAGFPGSAVVNHADEEIRGANQPNIRLLLIRKKFSDHPLRDYEDVWTTCTPETAAKFSAVAYFFGKQLAEHEHVPIGLIDSTWGGTPADTWISMDGLSSDPALMPVFAEWAHMANEQADIPSIVAAEKSEDAAARKANQPVRPHSWHPLPAAWAPAALFNGMVAPALEFRIKGVIWYQGESNSLLSRANMYEKIFPAMITDWRAHWHEGNFPFLFVQIANFTSTPLENWPAIREAQRRTLSLTDTGMAVTIDIGDPTNVHPSNKQDVGARLALAARSLAYGEQLEYSGPMYREIGFEDRALRVYFDHTTGGLNAKSGTVQGFVVAGEDHHFAPASARIDGAAVVMSSDQVPAPQFVRYGWANAPVVDLFNGSGLPASPFTSEDRIPHP